MTIVHKVQLFLKAIGFSRFMYDPHNGAELWTAALIWSSLVALVALALALFEWLTTPNYQRLSKDHKWSPVFVVSCWYLVIATVFVAGSLIAARVSPAVAAFLTMK